ncbi:protein-L-isoaspartate(D-aspartate) O-methyltransferase [Flexibacter flexilis DSM 6793]|uniref:Protein-L-isoaspartate O-methyltransferase n=1 Tax=Flexibacter flexilis DSM 6793 TaxID=927664 RepID=A0A1I1NGS9_9BACT|nr:protein-L-isoaspartate(D-aspartate) O-methyltransferase [Flexibacter flexilis]SFC96636.1 protein-L-isoaspartate(D-aspartate) O-methyltransferase [Flexibacter flexilis DSM 6793]
MFVIEDTYRQQGLRRGLLRILKEKGIDNPEVLGAIGKVPRHVFLERAFLEHAYDDKAFPIGEGQTISQPYTVARQSILLEVQKGHKVLEIGTGSGYQCCVLLTLGAKVFSIEYNQNLFRTYTNLLQRMGYNATFRCGDGSLGWPTYAPFDRILVTAGAPAVPDALIAQLAPNGIIVIPVGADRQQRMLRIRKDAHGNITSEDCGEAAFVPLLGENGWDKTSFFNR